MNINPIIGFFRTILLYVTGRVRFIKESTGKEFTMEDGRKFKVFWHVIIKPSYKNKKEPEAIFKIRFLPKNMSVEENKRFSRISIL